MSIASKLTKSVRQAKETGTNTAASLNSEDFKQSPLAAEKPATKAPQTKLAPRASRQPEPAITRFPSRRVWPD